MGLTDTDNQPDCPARETVWDHGPPGLYRCLQCQPLRPEELPEHLQDVQDAMEAG